VTDYVIPQHDGRVERPEQLAIVRAGYTYNMDMGFPVTASMRPSDEPARPWQVKALAEQQHQRLNLRLMQARGKWNFVNELPPLAPRKLASMIRAGDMAGIVDYFMPIPGGVSGNPRDKSLADFREVFALSQPPSIVERFHTDEYFAENMVAGPDPTRLTLMTEIPGKFPLAQAHLDSALPGDSLPAALAAGRVFWADYVEMSELDNGKHPQAPKYMYAPMAAFCVPRTGGPLVPFAIQCGQDPAGREIYAPADGYSWRLAKNCVLAAHNTYHEVLTHLGFTHLMSEPVLLSAVRNLAANHPVAVLLRRHFEGTFSINKLAVELLIQPGKAVEYLIGSDLASTYPWLAKHRAAYSFQDNALPARVERAGTGSLPHYPYRDDGMQVWNAISSWTEDFVTAYYASDAEVLSDYELQNWAFEVASVDGGQVRDFPAEIASQASLAAVLTMVIWTAGPQHAAVNFTQKEHMSFLPANPLAGYTPEPTGKDHTEADWLANLPPLDVAVQQFCVMNFLGSVRHTTLGDYEDDFRGTRVAAAHRRFTEELSSAEDNIRAVNRHRMLPYHYLQPSLIPNSTNI
jgi:arachidonate 15-lipoxygenase